MCEELPFEPLPLFSGSHQQTIIGTFFHIHRQPLSFCKVIELPDKDKLALEITTPDGWCEKDPTVVMIHGLCGSHRSPYLVRLTKKLTKLNIRAVRVNLRGCGSGRGLAKQIYHSGVSEDVLHVLKTLQKEHPESSLALIGFSMGGNIVLKLAGELALKNENYLQKVIALNPPIDLQKSVGLICLPRNRIYERYFLRVLRSDIYYRKQIFPDLPEVHLPRNMKFSHFDEIYTAPFGGFESAADYYNQCSSLPLIPEISTSCNILFSKDDPIISSTMLDDINLPENVTVYKTQKGGHMGYIGKRRFHWMDQVIIEWLQKAFS